MAVAALALAAAAGRARRPVSRTAWAHARCSSRLLLSPPLPLARAPQLETWLSPPPPRVIERLLAPSRGPSPPPRARPRPPPPPGPGRQRQRRHQTLIWQPPPPLAPPRARVWSRQLGGRCQGPRTPTRRRSSRAAGRGVSSSFGCGPASFVLGKHQLFAGTVRIHVSTLIINCKDRVRTLSRCVAQVVIARGRAPPASGWGKCSVPHVERRRLRTCSASRSYRFPSCALKARRADGIICRHVSGAFGGDQKRCRSPPTRTVCIRR